MVDTDVRPVRWVGSARRDLKTFPRGVQRDIGQAPCAAQCGETYPSVKALKGFPGASVLEIVAPFETDTYRAVYTVQFSINDLRLARFPEEGKARQEDGKKTST